MSNENTPAEPEQQDSGTPAPESADTDPAAAESESPATEAAPTGSADVDDPEIDDLESPEIDDLESDGSEVDGADTGTPDIGTPDIGTPDIGTPDIGTPDLDPSTAIDDVTSPFTPLGDDQQDDQMGDDTPPADAGGAGYVPPSPPPAPMVPPVRRLVRDPYAKLGGVASGVAHHYGIDVSLVRLGFILFTVFSGVGIILYLLAWLIIPRAEYWPPAPPPEGRSFSSALQGRELAYGLLAIGILLAVFAGGGDAARMLVSVGLVGAGIWMLIQPNSSRSGASVPEGPTPAAPATPSTPQATVVGATEQVPTSWQPAAAGDADSVSGADDTMTSNLAGSPGPAVATATAPGAPGGPPVYTTTQPVYVPNPVPPRRRRMWPLFLFLALLTLPLLFIAAIVGLAIASGEGLDVDIDADNVVELTPLTLEDLPASIDEGAGEIVIDLSELDTSSLDEADLPQSLDIDLNAGEVTIEVPEDLPVNVDASVGAGDITVFDNNSDGIRPRISVSEDDAVIDFDIRVGVGEVTVDH